MAVLRRGLLTLALAMLLVSGGLTPALGSGPDPAVAGVLDPEAAEDRFPVVRAGSGSGAPAQQVDGDEEIGATQAFALAPERPGEVTVTLDYSVPERVVSLNTTVPEGATLVETESFERDEGRRYAWTGDDNTASITYRHEVNETIQTGGPEAADGRYVYAGVGDWALFARPSMPTNWTYRGSEPLGFERRTRTVGNGTAGEWLVYLGEYEEYGREANGQRFQLIVPAAADLATDREAVLDSLARASDDFRVGDRDDEVFVVAAPTGRVGWGVRGAQTGDADMWVRDVQRLDTADNVWLHEYVHTRQRFRSTSETVWLNEGTATYYGALLSLEQGLIGFEAFADMLADGEHATYEEVVLSNSSTWVGHANYERGALIAGRLDLAIRRATGGERSLQDAVRQSNTRNDRLTQSALLATLGETGGDRATDAGRRYTERTATATMWNASTHSAAFGEVPARIDYSLPDPTHFNSFGVDGPYRVGSVGGSEPIRLVPGESLTVRARVNNSGGAAGDYAVPLTVDGTVVERAYGTVEAGESTTAQLNHTFDDPGRYEVGVDEDAVTVVVEQPATAAVTGLRVDRTTIRQGGRITATATVANDADRPGRATVNFTRGSEVVERRTVQLPSGTTGEVQAEIALPEAGTVSVGAENAGSTEIRVEPVHEGVNGSDGTPAATPDAETTAADPSATTTPGESTDGSGAGFGAVALAAAVALALLGRRL
ncbi:CARDB domain-containing protein [Halomicrobium urmianum]|uniref:CARDB domain-containing protein n=1 Tax=Halomicrobium urmianum TaxID=1586233 RepID=UPI001CD972F2|nr:CARDB domain-containing protein [Halomicrobium urmianum]